LTPHFCPLCNSEASSFYEDKKRIYLQCKNCSGIFLRQDFRLNPEAEKKRYLHHKNDINDIGYQDFLKPVVEAVEKKFNPDNRGLDYGTGPGPVLAYMLEYKGFNMELYDPFFFPSTKVLTSKYDFITCTEVIEHFHDPIKEFQKMYDLLGPYGKLFCMTNIYLPEIDFSKWHYKNDLTHVFIYTTRSLEYITEIIGFKEITIFDRLITFEK
jgi:SAM-dependent methyltransferase